MLADCVDSIVSAAKCRGDEEHEKEDQRGEQDGSADPRGEEQEQQSKTARTRMKRIVMPTSCPAQDRQNLGTTSLDARRFPGCRLTGAPWAPVRRLTPRGWGIQPVPDLRAGGDVTDQQAPSRGDSKQDHLRDEEAKRREGHHRAAEPGESGDESIRRVQGDRTDHDREDDDDQVGQAGSAAPGYSGESAARDERETG
jgi:hypothetical protein